MQTNGQTSGQVARSLGLAPWQVRRIVDGLGTPIPRVGLYRLIPSHLLGAIAIEAQRRGYLPSTEAAEA
jgi:hypothetical protein